AGFVCAGLLCAGCLQSRDYYFFNDRNLALFDAAATSVEAPAAEGASTEPAERPRPPITLETFQESLLSPISLDQAVQVCLANSKILRRLGTASGAIKGAGVALPSLEEGSLRAPEGSLPTVFDPALQQTNPGTSGPISVEAALSGFDVQVGSHL